MSVCCECCVLSSRGLCYELITRQEESCRLWWVVVCDLETSLMRSPCPTGGCRAKNKHTNKYWRFYKWTNISFPREIQTSNTGMHVDKRRRIIDAPNGFQCRYHSVAAVWVGDSYRSCVRSAKHNCWGDSPSKEISRLREKHSVQEICQCGNGLW